MKLRTGKLLDDLDLGVKMIQKCKFPVLPSPARPPRNIAPMKDADRSVAYYPGCSLHSTSPEFDHSARAVSNALDIKLVEPKGWICCGSSAAHRRDPDESIRLPIENLRIIEQSGFEEVTMPCAACFNRHKAAQYETSHDAGKKARAESATGYRFAKEVSVQTLSETILAHAGTDKIKKSLVQELEGLKVVCYYGCLLTRPPEVTGVDHPENPTDLDELMKALGAEVIDWSYKTACCGASHSLVRPDIVLALSRRLLLEAKATGADLIVVACPLCHTNLDARQIQMEMEDPIPVLFFTQLMAIGLGLEQKDIALDKNLIDPRPFLAEKGLI